MLASDSDLNSFRKRAKRGLIWRLAFMLASLAAFSWSWVNLNAMRFYTITQAPSYVPFGVEAYWLGTGVILGIMIVLVAEMMIYARRIGQAQRALVGRPATGPILVPLPPPPPGYRA
jgi:hypothetical protein